MTSPRDRPRRPRGSSAPTALLDTQRSDQRVSTGLTALDDVLRGLYWGDNVVWEFDAASIEPFYTAIARHGDQFESRTYVSFGDPLASLSRLRVQTMRAGPGTALSHPADLLREIHRICQPGGRQLLLFDSLDAMTQIWSASSTRAFFARCCPMLLDLGAIGYWSMGMSQSMRAVREVVESVTQCVLRVDDRSVRVAKAEARGHGVRGAVLHWHEADGRVVLTPAKINGRVAASLRALRRARGLSQHELATLAGVTASAISQAERAERGLSVGTLAQLSLALGLTIDDLVHGDDPDLYRIGRRDDLLGGDEPTTSLLSFAASDMGVDLVRLGQRQSARPKNRCEGTGVIAVASGLVQVQVAGQTPALRAGEVLVTASERVDGWRNIGQGEAMLFWIIEPGPTRRRPSPDLGGL